jgi:drug/metabolite transporter (DMT)-like permease
LSDQLKGLIITTLGVLCVVPDALFIRLIEANAMTVAFWRLLLSGLVILLMVLIQHGKHTPAKIVSIGRWGVLYAFLAAASALLFVTSVKLTTVANTTVILASMPVFAALISWLVLGETPSRRTLWTIALVVVGLLVIGYGTYTNDTGTDDTGTDSAGSDGTGSSTGATLTGDLAALAASFCFAIALTAARKARAKSMIPALPLAYFVCALLLVPFVDPLSIPDHQWWLVAMHGGFFVALSSSLLALGPRYIASAEVALLILMESILAPLLVWFVVGEEPGFWTLIGGALVLGVLCVSNVVALRNSSRRSYQSVS